MINSNDKRFQRSLNELGNEDGQNGSGVTTSGQIKENENAAQTVDSINQIEEHRQVCDELLSGLTNDKSYGIKDLKTLKEILMKILDLENGKISIKRCLMNIGKLSSQISYNKNANSVRNKHGYFRLNSEGINEDGICFEKLSQMRKLLYDHQFYSLINDAELEPLIGDLSRLKQKLISILEDGLDLNFSIANIFDFTDKYYQILVCKLIRNEINVWVTVEESEGRSMDFNERCDRYFLARILCKIGEQLKELVKFEIIKVNDQMKTSVLTSFKNLGRVRDRIVHNYEIISQGATRQIGGINETIAEIKRHLTAIICEESEGSGLFNFNYQYKDAGNFERDSNRLSKYLEQKRNNEDKDTLDKLIQEASVVLKEIEEGLVKKLEKKVINKLKNKLKNLDKQFQKCMKLVENIDGEYPKELNQENKHLILKISDRISLNDSEGIDNLEKLSTQENSKVIVDNVKVSDDQTENDYGIGKIHRQIDKINFYNRFLNIEMKFMVATWKENNFGKEFLLLLNFFTNQLLIWPHNLLEISVEEMETLRQINTNGCESGLISEQMYEINQVFQKLFDAISPAHNNQSEEYKTMVPKMDEIIAIIKERAAFKDSQHRFEDIKQSLHDYFDEDWHSMSDILYDELSHFISDRFDSELLQFPGTKKCEYVIQQTVLMIYQITVESGRDNLFKDINTRSILDQLQYDWPNVFLHKFLTSPFIKDGRRESNILRSRGLAHNLHFFDLSQFLLHIDDIFCLCDQFDAFDKVMQDDKSPSANYLLLSAEALMKISSYDKAVEYAQKTRERIRLFPDEIVTHVNDGDYIAVFKTSRFLVRIDRLTISALLSTGRLDESYVIIRGIIDKIDWKNFNKCANAEIRTQVSSHIYYLHMYESLTEGSIDRAPFAETVDKACDDSRSKLILAQNYFNTGKIAEAREIWEHISQNNSDACHKMTALYWLIGCHARDRNGSNSVEKMRNLISEMEMLKASDKELKNKLRDSYWLVDIPILDSRLLLFLAEYSLEGLDRNNLDNLIEIDSEFCAINEKIKGSIISASTCRMYLSLCIGYCHVYTGKGLDLDNGGGYLKTAKRYFGIGSGISSQVLFLKPVIQCAAKTLVKAYNNYVRLSQHLDFESQMTYLMEALELCDRYALESGDTLINIALKYYHRAGEYHDVYVAMHHKMFSDLAVNNYKLTKDYLRRRVNTGSYPSTNLNAIVYYLACCKANIACLKYDLRLIRYATNYASELYKMVPESDLRNQFQELNKTLELRLVNVIKVLKEILCSSNDFIVLDVYTIEYCHVKWHIDISVQSGKLEWKYKGNFSIQELKKQIEMTVGI